jgi:hypothetical protein
LFCRLAASITGRPHFGKPGTKDSGKGKNVQGIKKLLLMEQLRKTNGELCGLSDILTEMEKICGSRQEGPFGG